MSFRTDALYEIHWPDGSKSVTPLQFLRKGETITPQDKLFPAGMLVETRDSMTKNEEQAFIRRLNRIADSLEASLRARRLVTDARPMPTLDQRAEEAEQFADAARRLRRKALGQDDRTSSARVATTDAERSEDFVATAKKFHRRKLPVR